MLASLLLIGLSPVTVPPPTATLTPLGHTTAAPAEIARYVAAGAATLVDVREAPEWDEGHLAAATFVPLSEIARRGGDADFQAELFARVPRDKPVYTHCKSGGRCVQAADPLRALGYDVRPMREGYADLLSAGYEPAGE